ncbi:MAG: hypothetical protein RLZZ40_67 [Actinomycetota bacterium]
MRLLLPPSETKLKGGHPQAGVSTLSFPVQEPARRDLLVALESWSREEPEVAAKALKLGPKSIDELANNVFTDAPIMPAIARYTGVLYSATGVADWTPSQFEWATANIFIHSSLFGIISSTDEIQAYRLSYDSKVRGVALKDYWLGQLQAAIREMAAGDWILDCRSDGYRKLAPIPDGVESRYLAVVSAQGGKALNHFNKIHKGELVRALVTDSPVIASSGEFVTWAGKHGLTVRETPQTITLVV